MAAIEAGAAALVVERWLDVDVPQAKVPSVRRAMGPVSARAFGDPASAMTMLGVTGTNGKTTTTYLVEGIVRAAGFRAGVIGTTGARADGQPVPLVRTTPEAPDLHRLLARMRDAGVEVVAMEVSSHALDQDRVGGVRFDAVAFTNLSQDHLDYHPSMAAYFAAKASVFTPAHAARGTVNADDPWGRRLLERAGHPAGDVRDRSRRRSARHRRGGHPRGPRVPARRRHDPLGSARAVQRVERVGGDVARTGGEHPRRGRRRRRGDGLGGARPGRGRGRRTAIAGGSGLRTHAG